MTILLAAAAMLVTGAAQADDTQAQSCHLTTREVVTKFFDAFYIKKQVRTAFETWVAPGYIQHNPSAASGRDAAIAFLEPFFTNNPGISYSIKRIIAEGDMAAVHSHGKFAPGDRGMAIVDIVRVENCKIVEHWDVVQPVPEKSMNENTMF
ncbi:MAG: nuclear transport factor 2 family protein [Novosphingobium sp.]